MIIDITDEDLKKYDIILLHDCCTSGMKTLMEEVRQFTFDNDRQPKVKTVGIFNVRDMGYATRYNIDLNTLKQVSYILFTKDQHIKTVINK